MLYTSMVCPIRGLQKYPKSIRIGDTFRRWLVTMDFDDISLQKYVQLIIQSLLYISMVWAIWGLPKCPKFTCCGHTFRRWLVTVDFDDVFNTKVCSVHHIIIVVYINGVLLGVFRNVANPYAVASMKTCFSQNLI